ncbi:AraC family transcriptional regulator, partial [Clostridium perfringens]
VKNIGYLFSKNGSAYMLEDMAKPGVGFYYENWPYEDLVETLDTLDATIVRPVEDVVIPGNNRMRMLTFLQPLPVGGSHSPGAVLIMVREDTILRMMKSVSETYRGEFFIFDGQGKPLVASNGSVYRSSDDLSRRVDGMGQTAGPVSGIHKINGVSYLVSATVSEKNGWKYVSMLPESATLQGIRTI